MLITDHLSLITVLLYFSNVKLIHRGLRTTVNQDLQCIDCPFEAGFDDLHFVLRDRLQNVVRGVLPWGWSPDADFEPDKLSSSQRFDHRLDAVMAAMAASLFNAQASGLQIQIVVDENQIVGGELELAEEALQRRAGHVHEIERAGQFDQL